MSLADQVIEANKEQERGYELDELGIGIADTPDYVVARILYRNTLEMEQDLTAGLIHTRRHKTQLWKGNRELHRDKKTIYKLAKLNRILKDYELDAIWDSLLKNTPELDESKIVVSGHTYWDIEKGELCYTRERLLTI